jgi:DNA-binding IscR family transcriptional regulator
MSGPFIQLSSLDNGKGSQFKSIWADVDRAIAGVLNNVTFEELVRRERSSQRHLMYHI